MSRTLRIAKDLALAMINATLILIAVCLFLGLRLSDRVGAIANEFAAGLVELDGMRSEVSDLRQEVADLRADLAETRSTVQARLGGVSIDNLVASVRSEMAPEQIALMADVNERLERIDALGGKIDTMTEAIDEAAAGARSIAADPVPVAEALAGALVGDLTDTAVRIAGCAPAPASG
ncbi:MAG: hypothetical protein AAF667_09505 [Pseudomonadota bacterium]